MGKSNMDLVEDIGENLVKLLELTQPSSKISDSKKRELVKIIKNYEEFVNSTLLADSESEDKVERKIDPADVDQKPLEAGAAKVFQAL